MVSLPSPSPPPPPPCSLAGQFGICPLRDEVGVWCGKRTISSLQLPGKLMISDKMPSPGRPSPPPWQGSGNTEGAKGAFIEAAAAGFNS